MEATIIIQYGDNSMEESIKVIQISAPKSVSEEIADLAYDFWLERCFRNGALSENVTR